jgi:serine/threonine protein kinase
MTEVQQNLRPPLPLKFLKEPLSMYDLSRIDGLPVFGWSDFAKASLLGRGCTTVVHRVIEKSSRRQYALKSLDLRRLDHGDCLQSFTLAASDLAIEAAILSQLDNENIVKLRGVSSTNLAEAHLERSPHGSFFLLLDVLEDTLDMRLQRWRKSPPTSCKKTRRRSRLSNLFGTRKKRSSKVADPSRMYDRVRTIALDVARAMKYLHDRGMLLRDLKPANIGFDAETGKVQLFDFGMARHVHDCPPEEVCGTLRYMAPEVMLGQGHSFHSDVYCFGMVLYELCSLQMPNFKWKTLGECLRDISICAGRPSLDSIPCDSLKDLISACWSPKLSDRTSFASILNILQEILVEADKTILIDSERASCTENLEDEEGQNCFSPQPL